jgi:hypothetical protein
MSHPACRPLGVTFAAVLLLAPPSSAARKVTCPDGRYVLVSGADAIATTPGIAPTLDVVGRAVTVLDGCPMRHGRAKPTRKGLRLSGRFRGCGTVAALTLKALVPATCDTVSGQVRGRGRPPGLFAGLRSLCGNGVLDGPLGEQCDVNVPCQDGSACSQTCRCGGGSGSTTTTTVPGGGGGVTVTVDQAFCTADACSCASFPGFDYHLQATGTVTGPVGTELRVNVSALGGGQLDCGSWSPIDSSVNPACVPIACCRRDVGQPETASWAATEAIDLPCYCPSAPPGLAHNYLGQAQLPPGAAVEDEKTTAACP